MRLSECLAMLFSHLHVHSCYSLQQGADWPHIIAQAAIQKGYKSLALTDTGGIYGAIRFQKACDEVGLKPIHGVTLPQAVLLVRNESGWAAMCRAITLHATGKELNLIEELDGCDDLYVLSPDKRFLSNAKGRIPRLYAELIVHESDTSARSLARFAYDNHLPCVATNAVQMVNKEDHKIPVLLSAIRLIKPVRNLSLDELPRPDAYLKSPSEMWHKFRWHSEAFANAQRIADDCNFRIPLDVKRLPRYDRLIEPTAMDELRLRCVQGISRRYPERDVEAVERLNRELEVVQYHKIPDYFLCVHEIVSETWRRGHTCFARGSAANSIVNYLLGISHVDPIQFDLVFERFMNFERADLPDIDLDFSWRVRDEIIQFVYDRFGHDRVAMISTHNTYKVRSACRDIAKALGIAEYEIAGEVERFPRVPTARFLSEWREIPECRGLAIDQEPWTTILPLAERVDRFPRHLSEHPCGLVIAPNRLDEIIPLEKGAKGNLLTQWEMHGVEDAGLLKVDLLSTAGITVVDDSLKVINSRRKPENHLTIDDLKYDGHCQHLMATGNTMGAFYIESPTMRGLLIKLFGAKTAQNYDAMELLVAASSIVRPGPSQAGLLKAFIERHSGREKVTYLHPELERHLGRTYGLLVYQEDVMVVVNRLFGLSMGEADRLRKAMTKELGHKPMSSYRDQLLNAAQERGVDTDVAKKIIMWIESFYSYSFVKGHSAAFAVISLQALWLRAHYPAEFMASVLTGGKGFYRAAAYVQECRRMGLKILPPYVSQAKWEYQGRGRYVMVGLRSVKNLKEKTARLIEERQPFASVFDFLDRVDPSINEAESLVRAGALDRFGHTRPELMQFVYSPTPAASHPVLNGCEPQPERIQATADYSLHNKLIQEIDALSFAVTAHPLALFSRAAKGTVPAREIRKYIGRKVDVLLWLVHRQRARTKGGELMIFLTGEDQTGDLECVVFPRTYSQYGYLLKGPGPYRITGSVEEEYGVVTVNAQKVRKLDADIGNPVSELGNG